MQIEGTTQLSGRVDHTLILRFDPIVLLEMGQETEDEEEEVKETDDVDDDEHPSKKDD